MDAREAHAWLQSKLRQQSSAETDRKLRGEKDHAPLSELQWRKLKTLMEVSFGMNRNARDYVATFYQSGIGTSITRNQSEYIETLWHRYRKQHKYKLAQPVTEIMRFNQDLPIESYECSPENDEFTIGSCDPDEDFFR